MSEYLAGLNDWRPLLLQGIGITILVTILTMALSTVLGLVVATIRVACMASTHVLARICDKVLKGYIDVMRGLPLIVTLFIFFFALPGAGLMISESPLVVGVLGFTLTIGAYLAEVFRAAILSVDKGQMEAAMSLGMNPVMAYRKVVLPQAMVVATPTLGGYFISTLKDSSLLGFISVMDLMRTGIMLVSTTFRAFEVYMTIGAIYLILSLAAAKVINRIEYRASIEGRSLRHLEPLDRPDVVGAGAGGRKGAQ